MSNSKRDLYINALRQAGKRITDQRRIICDYLAQTESHPTPAQVYSDLSAIHPEISRATVYNTLNVLKDLGAIVEIGFGADHSRYDTDNQPHINLVCLRCHEISDYAGPLPFDDVKKSLAGQEAFLPMVMRVEILGFCEKCRERKKAEIRQQWLARRTARLLDTERTDTEQAESAQADSAQADSAQAESAQAAIEKVEVMRS